MHLKYDSVLNPWGPDAEEGFFTKPLHAFSMKELLQIQTELEESVSNLHSQEPHQKRGRKNQYRFWVAIVHGKIYQLKMVRDEIVSRKMHLEAAE